VFARKYNKFEIDSFYCLLIFPQAIDTKASNHCVKLKSIQKSSKFQKLSVFVRTLN